MRVLLIGGTRFIGPTVARRLVGAGHEVTVFHRGEHEAGVPAGIRHIHAPQAAIPVVRFPDEVRAVGPDVVVHMDAYGEADAEAFVRAFAGHAGRAVVISSCDVYRAYGRLIGTEPGPPDAIPLAENSPLRERYYPHREEQPRAADDPARWRDDYDKILVERVVRSAPDLPATVLRLPAVYGPGDYQHRVWEFLPALLAGREAILLPEDYAGWRWTRGYVENVGAAIALAVERAPAPGTSPIYNVGEERALTTREWAQAIGTALGWHGEIVTAPRDALPATLLGEGTLDTRQDFTTASTRLRDDLGYREPISREEALERTVAWERAHPPEHLPQRDFAAEDTALRDLRRDERG